MSEHKSSTTDRGIPITLEAFIATIVEGLQGEPATDALLLIGQDRPQLRIGDSLMDLPPGDLIVLRIPPLDYPPEIRCFEVTSAATTQEASL